MINSALIESLGSRENLILKLNGKEICTILKGQNSIWHTDVLSQERRSSKNRKTETGKKTRDFNAEGLRVLSNNTERSERMGWVLSGTHNPDRATPTLPHYIVGLCPGVFTDHHVYERIRSIRYQKGKLNVIKRQIISSTKSSYIFSDSGHFPVLATRVKNFHMSSTPLYGHCLSAKCIWLNYRWKFNSET